MSEGVSCIGSIADVRSAEYERAYVGALLLGGARALAMGPLDPADLFEPRWRYAAECVAALVAEGQPVDLLTVEARAKAMHSPPRVTMEDLVHVIAECPTSENIGFYARRLRSLALSRAVRLACSEAVCRDITTDGEEVLAQIVERLTALRQGATGSRQARLADLYSAAGQEIVGRNEESPSARLLRTGYRAIDDRWGGLPRGGLTILAGRPRQGKTALAVNLCLRVAEAGAPCALVSLESDEHSLAMRGLSAQSGVGNRRLRGAVLGPDEMDSVLATVNRARDRQTPLWIVDAGDSRLGSVAATIRGLRLSHGVEMVVVDHLQRIGASRGLDGERIEGGETQRVGRAAKDLADLARQIGVALVVLCQLRRPPDGQKERKPRLEDLRQSGEIEEAADLVLGVHRPGVETPDNDSLMVLSGLKVREGIAGDVRLAWRGDNVLVTDLAPDRQEEDRTEQRRRQPTDEDRAEVQRRCAQTQEAIRQTTLPGVAGNNGARPSGRKETMA